MYRQGGGDYYYIPSRDSYLLLGFGEEGVIPSTYFSGSQYRNYQRGQVMIPYRPAGQVDEGDPHNWRLEGKPCSKLSLDELEKHSVRPAFAPFYQQRWRSYLARLIAMEDALPDTTDQSCGRS